MTDQEKASAAPFDDVLEEHWDDLDFLWTQREHLAFDADFDLVDLAEHEERIAAHLDGIRIAGDREIERIREHLGSGEDGLVAAATLLLLERGPDEHASVIKALEAGEDGVRQALRHAPTAHFEALAGELERLAVSARSSTTRAAALDVLAFRGRRITPDRALTTDEEPQVRELAWGALGRLGLLESSDIEAVLHDAEPTVRSAGLYALARAGLEGVVAACLTAATRRTDPDGVALEFLGVLGVREHEGILIESLERPDLAPFAVRGLGAMGTPAAVERLAVEVVRTEDEAAFEAWNRITGLDCVVEVVEQATTAWLAVDRSEGRWQAGRVWVASQWPATSAGVSLQCRRDLFITARCAGLTSDAELEARTARQLGES